MKNILLVGLIFSLVFSLDASGSVGRLFKSSITLRAEIARVFQAEEQAYKFAVEDIQLLDEKRKKLKKLETDIVFFKLEVKNTSNSSSYIKSLHESVNESEDQILRLKFEIKAGIQSLRLEKLPNILHAFSKTKEALKPYEALFSIDYKDEQKYLAYSQLCYAAFKSE